MSGGLSASGGNNSSQTYQTSNSSNTSTPPPAIEGILKNMSQGLTNYYLQNPNAPAYYPGSTVAQFSPQTIDALQALYGRGASGSPVINAADNADAATLNGQYLNIGSNPYFQSALAAGFQPQTDQLMNTVLPGLRSQFQGAGRTGSGADFDTTMRAVKDLDQTQANAAATAANNAYGQERANQMQAMSLAPQLADQDFLNLNAMLQAGQAIDQKQQQNIDADVARYNYQQTAQPSWITNLAQQLQAIYPGGQTTGNSSASGTSTQAYDNFGGELGAKFLSDRRLKTDIRPVGKLLDGQTIYSYRFRGSPRTQLGLIAQEVEKRRPDAVSRHPSGFKMVDYRKATTPKATTPKGGLL
jgi:hypothetical protein